MESNEQASQATPLDGLTPQQLSFCQEFIRSFKGAESARKAGYSENSAAEIAYENLRKPQIIAALNYLGEQQMMSAGEAAMHFTDIARTRLNDFFVTREVQGREQVEQYVTVLLEAAHEEIESIRVFMNANIEGKRAKRAFQKRIEELQLLCLEYEADIRRWGNDVTRLAPGKPCTVRVAELDLVAIAEAHQAGRIKSYSTTKEGVRVEMHDVSNALDKLLQLHGRYKQLPGDLGKDSGRVVVVREMPDGQIVRPGDKLIKGDGTTE